MKSRPYCQSMWQALVVGSALVVVAAFWSGCGGTNVMTLPSPVSPPPGRYSDGLWAGFGRADITPPPGVSLAGNGPEARQAVGYRHRLYVRTMVLENHRGQRLALVVADLPLMSPIVHRLVAVRTLKNGTGIGADRLFVSVTHTHAGPGNFFGAKSYNLTGGVLAGYDETMVDFLVDRIAATIEWAVVDLKPAKAAWDTLHVKGLTTNRSLDAFERNVPPVLSPRPRNITPVQLVQRKDQAVDPVMTMLRVDRCDDRWLECYPKGAYTIFAIHGTGHPAANSLLDGDIHAIVQRKLESHIASGNQWLGYNPSQALHLFANGTQGDVSPKHFVGTRCERLLKQELGRGPGGPWRPTLPEVWRAPLRDERECLELARLSVNSIGDQLGDRAIVLFNRIESKLQNRLEIGRAFTTLHIPTMHLTEPLCAEPRSGVAQTAGSTEDAGTRMVGWKVLGLIPTNIAEGGEAVDPKSRGCHGAKRELLGSLQGLTVGEYGFQKYMQLGVVRIGNTVFAGVPVEATTVIGFRMKDAMRRWFTTGIDHVAVVSLTNGYLSYLTTREEYSAQHYEGGSTLYGPNSGAAFTEQLGRLAQGLAAGAPIVEVKPMVVNPGNSTSYFAPRDRGPANVNRELYTLTGDCSNLVMTWKDEYPGALLPAVGPVLNIEREIAPNIWNPILWDDHRSIEVRAIGKVRGGYKWEVRWVPDRPAPGRYRVALLQRQGRGSPLNRLESGAISCP